MGAMMIMFRVMMTMDFVPVAAILIEFIRKCSRGMKFLAKPYDSRHRYVLPSFIRSVYCVNELVTKHTFFAF